MKAPGPEIRLPLNWRTLGSFLLLPIGFFAFVGIVARTDVDFLYRLFDLDFENNFPTAFSALLLLANAWWVIRLKKEGVLGKWALWLGVIFLFMGLDEVFRFHERLERLTSVHFHIFFLPLVLLAACGWLHVLNSVRRDVIAAGMWIGGAAAWLASQILESAEWGWLFGPDKPADGYVIMMIAEELLEMSGSTLFLLALLKLQEKSRSRQPEEVSLPAVKSSGI